MSANKIKTVLIDLSGTIHVDDEEISGSKESLTRLRSQNVNIKFITNTTKESKQSARHVIEKRNVRPFMMVDDRALEDFKGIQTDNPNAVLIGLAPDKFNYKTMNTAFRLIQDGCPLIAIHKARYYKKTDELALGPGPFVTALEYATDTTAHTVGKPQASFFLSSVEEFNCRPEECVMIGDDVRDDINGAQKTGMLGILVKTGKYRIGDEDKINSKPFKVVDDFQQAVEVIENELM
ncbi:Haloacid dehalogenase-like hydrolase domain-containing protein 2 [Mytilus coruscus]|uniref:Haloacid dehalogenase-like hydrolase domain-containing protein 2 n=1 Tax=Mytilus coruscus TaxID=42192 RepID=A0A6J8A8D3_MYTCO|nr:Haloacid dehalogenase-like hydrolase domain-containing protein 2 [Mytilus coruscus]